uniref:Cytochrome b-c1 complex subunit 6 n=1 Tax=Acrobeloides nanus TaxID=290746 RepID=A0A914D1F1_9BILA
MPDIDPNTDQLTQFREICEPKMAKFKEALEECNERVNGKPGTLETCHQEMIDYINQLDHCAMPKAFKSLK